MNHSNPLYLPFKRFEHQILQILTCLVNSCSSTYAFPKSGFSILIHLLFLLPCCSAETEFISLEVLKLEKQISEKQVNTILFHPRFSVEEMYHSNRVLQAPYLQCTLWGSKSKMAVTPKEILFTGDEGVSCSVHDEHVEWSDVIGPRRITLFATLCTKRQIKKPRLTSLPPSVGGGWI